ncbi:MAG: PDZ domain-containing protein [Planctomycetia bacterium]|nr:PDZ domain-containing protein [Planctomycetia bacterium]
MIRTRYLLATALVLFASLPAFAQRGGPPRGGNNFNRGAGNFNNFNNFNRGGTSFGITLGNPRSGLSFSYGNSPFGNFYNLGVGGAGYRPYYGGGYGGYGYGGYGFNSIYPAPYIAPRSYVIPQTYYVPQTTYVVPGTPTVTTVAPAAPVETTTTTATEHGLYITELKAEGTAKAAGLRQGDVILAVDGQRIQNYEALRAILTAAGKKTANVEYIDGSNNQIEKKDVAVVDGKLGITIEEVPLQRQ